MHREHERFSRADGTTLPVEYWAYPLSGAREPGAVLVTFVDLRERLAAKRELRLASTVFESVDRALVITDAAANIVSVNPAYTQLTGWSKEDVLGRNPRFRQSGRHESDFYRAMWGTLLGTGRWEGEIWNLRKDGACYLEEVTITTVLDSRGQISHYVAAIRDLTEERRRSQALECARFEAEKANAAKSRFVANMSHEIRTPLTAILGFAETLAAAGRSPLEHAQAVETILRNTRYLQELVNDILDFSKIEADRLEVERIATELPRLLHEIADLAHAQAIAKVIELSVVVVPPWPRFLMTDPTRMKQILMNLLSNAIKFTERGAVTLRVSFDAARERLVCAVEDTGPGIATDRLAEIFDAFAQADASTTRSHGGSGLGLTISRALARMLGGDLTVCSTPGVGSVFTATFATGPVSESQLEQIPPELTGPHSAHFAIEQSFDQRPRLQGAVLLAEDYPDSRALIADYISRTGACVTAAENGQEAVELAQQQAFDLVLMDMQMPVLDGLDATRLLRLTGFDGPVVALTANATEADRAAARAAGCDGFLAKPIQRGPFYATLARHLKPAQPDQPSPQALWPSVTADFAALRERFLSGLPAQLDALRQAAAGREYLRVASVAHQLKGVAGTFGAAEATRTAGVLERAARDGDEAAVLSLLRQLEDSCQQVLS